MISIQNKKTKVRVSIGVYGKEKRLSRMLRMVRASLDVDVVKVIVLAALFGVSGAVAHAIIHMALR